MNYKKHGILMAELRTWAKNDKNFKQNGTTTTNYHNTKASTHELLTETIGKYNGNNVQNNGGGD